VKPVYARRIRIIVKIIGDVGIPLPVIGLGGFYIHILTLKIAVRFGRIVILYLRAV